MSNVIYMPLCGMCDKVIHKQPVHELHHEFHIDCWNNFVDDMEKIGNERLEDFNEHFDEVMEEMALYYDEE